MKTKNDIKKAADISYTRPKLTRQQRSEVMAALQAHRQQVAAARTPLQALRLELAQLKYIMQAYADSARYDPQYSFAGFLKQYVAILQKKNVAFAEEMNVTAVELSQVMNGHRKPNETFLFKLEVHSNRNLPALTWYRILEKEKQHGLFDNTLILRSVQKEIKPEISFSL